MNVRVGVRLRFTFTLIGWSSATTARIVLKTSYDWLIFLTEVGLIPLNLDTLIGSQAHGPTDRSVGGQTNTQTDTLNSDIYE